MGDMQGPQVEEGGMLPLLPQLGDPTHISFGAREERTGPMIGQGPQVWPAPPLRHLQLLPSMGHSCHLSSTPAAAEGE